MSKFKLSATVFVALFTILIASSSADDKRVNSPKTTPTDQRPPVRRTAAPNPKPVQGTKQTIKGSVSKPPQPAKSKEPPPPTKR
jgi:hypothetical protein